MAGCVFTPNEIDAMPMQDALALLAYWHDYPPAHEILAAVHGVPRSAPRSPSDPSGIGAMMARYPDGIVTSKGK